MLFHQVTNGLQIPKFILFTITLVLLKHLTLQITNAYRNSSHQAQGHNCTLPLSRVASPAGPPLVLTSHLDILWSFHVQVFYLSLFLPNSQLMLTAPNTLTQYSLPEQCLAGTLPSPTCGHSSGPTVLSSRHTHRIELLTTYVPPVKHWKTCALCIPSNRTQKSKQPRYKWKSRLPPWIQSEFKILTSFNLSPSSNLFHGLH